MAIELYKNPRQEREDELKRTPFQNVISSIKRAEEVVGDAMGRDHIAAIRQPIAQRAGTYLGGLAKGTFAAATVGPRAANWFFTGNYRFGSGLPTEVDTTADDARAQADRMMQQARSHIDLQMSATEGRFQRLAALAGENLSPAGQAALDDLFQQTQTELDSIDSDIIETQQAAAAYELLKNPSQRGTTDELRGAGVAPTGSATADMMAKIVSQSGVTKEQAMASGLTDADVNRLSQRGEQLLDLAAAGENVEGELDNLSAETASIYADSNLASAKSDMAFQLQLRAGLRDLTEQRRAITENFDDVQNALQAEDIAQQAGKFTFDIDNTPQGAYNEAFGERLGSLFDTLPDTRTEDEQANLATAVMELDAIAGPGLQEDETTQQGAIARQQVIEFASANGIDPTELLAALQQGRQLGLETQDSVEKVWESRTLTPSSRALGTAIYQVAEASNPDPEFAKMLANSPSMHMIIELGSKGRVGYQGEGTISGLGGLTDAQYRSLGYSPEDVKGDARKELAALIDLISADYGGDPQAALRHFAEHKSWGA